MSKAQSILSPIEEAKNLPKKMMVSYPIEVPEGKYCWESIPPFALCERFNNEGGYASCSLDFDRYGKIKETKEGYLKPLKCAKLKKA